MKVLRRGLPLALAAAAFVVLSLALHTCSRWDAPRPLGPDPENPSADMGFTDLNGNGIDDHEEAWGNERGWGTRGDGPFLSVSTSRDTYETLDVVALQIRGASWAVVRGEDGNDTVVLEPSNDLVDVTLYAADADVVVKRISARLFNGSVDAIAVVERSWTTNQIEVSVVDYASGLVASAEFRTIMSQEELVFRIDHSNWEGMREVSATLSATSERERAENRALTAGLTLTLVALAVVVLLKTNHLWSMALSVPSVAERLSFSLFPYTIHPHDETGYWLDPRTSWDRPTARRFLRHRAEAHAMKVDAEVALMQAEKTRILAELAPRRSGPDPDAARPAGRKEANA